MTLGIALGIFVVPPSVVVRAGTALIAGDRAGDQHYAVGFVSTTKTPVTRRSI